MSETIIASATPSVPTALAVVRMSGPSALEIATTLAGDRLKPGRVHYRVLRDGDEVIDDAVVLVWRGPRSSTGEDVVEFSCHGSPLITAHLLRVCGRLGARPAEPGEFTRRAFLNGRIDLTQAEAVGDLIHARSERALRAVRQFQSGAFGRRLEEFRETLLQVLSHVEAAIDFPDEDIEPDAGAVLMGRIEHLTEQVSGLLAAAAEGRFLRQGASVVLAGAPNAGKSSLMNALLGDERVLVSELPGTTRDSIDAECVIGGFPMRLTDTAGLRESEDALERLGMERTRRVLEGADVVLHLADGSAESGESEVQWLAPDSVSAPVLCVLTKADLPRRSDLAGWSGLVVSARTGAGLDELRMAILSALNLDQSPVLGESLAVNARHAFHLEAARDALTRAQVNFAGDAPLEMTAADLRVALFSLGEIVGETSNEDMLDRLFRNFCIGK